MTKWAFICLLGLSLPCAAQVTIEKPWARATPPSAKLAAGYLVIRNAAPVPDRLVSVSSPAAARVETHVTVKEGEVFKMREVKGYEVPAKGSFELKPGGPHLMFIDIREPFRIGARVPATLRFEKGGEVKVELEVSLTTPESPHHKH